MRQEIPRSLITPHSSLSSFPLSAAPRLRVSLFPLHPGLPPAPHTRAVRSHWATIRASASGTSKWKGIFMMIAHDDPLHSSLSPFPLSAAPRLRVSLFPLPPSPFTLHISRFMFFPAARGGAGEHSGTLSIRPAGSSAGRRVPLQNSKRKLGRAVSTRNFNPALPSQPPCIGTASLREPYPTTSCRFNRLSARAYASGSVSRVRRRGGCNTVHHFRENASAEPLPARTGLRPRVRSRQPPPKGQLEDRAPCVGRRTEAAAGIGSGCIRHP